MFAAVLAALALPTAHAREDAETGAGTVSTAAGDGERGKAAAERSGERGRDADRSDAGSRTGDDLESCKRDADGMRGPERSRFMTQCLKERK